MSHWVSVRIGDILEKSESWVPIEPDEEYKEVTVRLWGRGVALRGVKSGLDISSSKRLKVIPGQFIVSRIDARHGAFGLIPEELDGAVVTNDFPVFTPKKDQLDINFLGWLSKTHGFVEACKRASEGTTNRVRLKEDRFAKIEVELPLLDEQHRIVTKIESLDVKIDEARRLREEILTDAQAMLRSSFQEIIKSAEYRPMAEVAPIIRRKVEIDIDGEYPELGVRSFHKGTFSKCTSLGMEIAHKKMFHIEPGDLIFSNIMAWEGAIAVARPEDKGRIGVHRFITCVPEKQVVTSDFLGFYFQTGAGFQKIVEASPATIARNRTLSVKKLEKMEVPVPDYDKQIWFNSLQAKVAAIQQTQAENQTELDALLPAILDKAFRGDL